MFIWRGFFFLSMVNIVVRLIVNINKKGKVGFVVDIIWLRFFYGYGLLWVFCKNNIRLLFNIILY